MTNCSKKLYLVLIWMSVLFASCHCQRRFRTTATSTSPSTLTIITITFSIIGPILAILVCIGCCTVCYFMCNKKRSLSDQYLAPIPVQPHVVQSTHTTAQHDVYFNQHTQPAFPHNSSRWQYTMATSTNQNGRQEAR